MKPLGDDLVARQTSKNTIAVIRGNKNKWKMVAETGLVEGKVNTMILTPDGSKLIYDIVKEQRQEIFVLYVDTNNSIRISSRKRTSNFIKIVTNFESGIAILFQENDNALNVSFFTEFIKKKLFLIINFKILFQGMAGGESMLHSTRYW